MAAAVVRFLWDGASSARWRCESHHSAGTGATNNGGGDSGLVRLVSAEAALAQEVISELTVGSGSTGGGDVVIEAGAANAGSSGGIVSVDIWLWYKY